MMATFSQTIPTKRRKIKIKTWFQLKKNLGCLDDNDLSYKLVGVLQKKSFANYLSAVQHYLEV